MEASRRSPHTCSTRLKYEEHNLYCVNRTILSVAIMFIAASVFFFAPVFSTIGVAPAVVESVSLLSFGMMAGGWMTFLLLAGESDE